MWPSLAQCGQSCKGFGDLVKLDICILLSVLLGLDSGVLWQLLSHLGRPKVDFNGI